MPTITTINVNGIRAAVKHRNERNHGLLPWLAASDSDVIALQEVRASDEEARDSLAPALDDGWHLVTAPSSVKGHAGVALLSRTEPTAVRVGFGSTEFDDLGRYIEADYQVGGEPLTAGSLYLPKGAVDPAVTKTATEKDTAKFDEKKRFLAEFGEFLARHAASGNDVVVGGDWNIAATENDIKAWKTNKKSPGFLPHERDWLAGLFADGWNDVMRDLVGNEPGPYSWWSWRGKAFDNDSGWRIDFHAATAGLAERAVKAYVHRPDAYDLRWSDHAPVTAVFG
ncbi:exodeoxyribonuclease [Gordonia effusa NBRC 100432]|uniref:Exodeoxyribonuclease n=1 Tax=Gordonia effusa NBRC 100432 TaxID=1077974 RepID=H0R3W1_9ACTN|nr:exodeoxyribonuclease III [Gordonia effusa]GAB19762.1 exodeoxyribonuclease [Gordonia effusa NBRC 100432]